jgi:glycosyltransferase involved in cell wall biosynthesis
VKIAWWSNSPNATTGYGTQTKMMLPRLMADGHEVAVLGLWGNQAGMDVLPTPDGNVPIFPSGAMHYGLDVIDDQARYWFGDRPGWVITLYDVWVIGNRLKDQRIASWTPVDHYPVPPGVLKWAREHRTIAMSKFGQRAMAEAGIPSVYIPHALEASYKPTPAAVREQMAVPEDAFLVMMNAANIGTPQLDRKAWVQNLRAFAVFARNHDDVYLYLHTDPTRPDGFPIPQYLSFLGMPEERTRITDLFAYRANLITNENMVEIYSGADVLLACSSGEGFGLPVAESMLCGTPAIVTDFSAQPEIVGDTGWTVGFEQFWDKAQRSDVAMPWTSGIVEALEEAYAEKGTDKARERSAAAEAHARAEYDADTVYAEKWRPYLAELEAELQPKSVRKGMSKAAKRRNVRRAA